MTETAAKSVPCREQFVCTHCKVLFTLERPTFELMRLTARCPRCQDSYDKFFTHLIRTGTFAFAYWREEYDGPLEDLGKVH